MTDTILESGIINELMCSLYVTGPLCYIQTLLKFTYFDKISYYS